MKGGGLRAVGVGKEERKGTNGRSDGFSVTFPGQGLNYSRRRKVVRFV